MAVDLRAKLREFMDSLGADDADEEVEADEVADGVEGDGATDDGDAEVEQAGDGATDAAEAESDDEEESLLASEVSESELRDSLNVLAAENESLRATNEALRTRLAELGGEAEVEADELGEVDDVEVDADDPYDDEAATLDLDKQRAEIAALMGSAN